MSRNQKARLRLGYGELLKIFTSRSLKTEECSADAERPRHSTVLSQEQDWSYSAIVIRCQLDQCRDRGRLPQRFRLRIISSSFSRSASKIFSFERVSSERSRLSSFSNFRRVLAGGSGRSLPGDKLFAISFQYSQTRNANAQTISGASTKKKMVLAQLLFLFFRFATFESIT